jgi:hypothetical protein
MTPAVALSVSSRATAAGAAEGFAASTSAAAPATNGVAMDVPLWETVALSEENHADLIDAPGAYRSTQLPKFEYESCMSYSTVPFAPDVEAATVSALGALAGE